MSKPGDLDWHCDCADCQKARKQLLDRHPWPDLGPNPFLMWAKSANQKYAEGWERTFGKKR